MAYYQPNKNSKGETISYTAQIDMKGVRMKKTFPLKPLAVDWVKREEGKITAQDANIFVSNRGKTIGDLVRDYIADARKHGKSWSPSKDFGLKKIIDQIGDLSVKNFNRQRLFDYCAKMRETMGPSGTQERLIYLGTVFGHARHEWQLDVPLEEYKSAMAVLRKRGKHGGITNTVARNRDFTQAQIDAVKANLVGSRASLVAEMVDILSVVPFRVSELCAIKWSDIDPVRRTVTLRNWEGGDNHKGTTRLVTLTMIGDVDAYELIAGRPRLPGEDYVFPVLSNVVSCWFSKAASRTGIDMHLHDMRHHAISKMFAVHHWEIPAVTHYTGHKNWKVLAANYGKLNVNQMHQYAEHKRREAMRAQREQTGHNGGPNLD